MLSLLTSLCIWVLISLQEAFAVTCFFHEPNSSVPKEIIPGAAGIVPDLPYGCARKTFPWEHYECELYKDGNVVGSYRPSGNLDCWYRELPNDDTNTKTCTVLLQTSADTLSKSTKFPVSVGQTVNGYFQGKEVTVGCVNSNMYLTYE